MVSRLKKVSPFARKDWQLSSLAPWALLFLVAWLCWQLASLFWLFLNPPTAPIARPVALGGANIITTPNIIGFKLFNEAGSVPTEVQSNVPMHLEGVFVAEPASRGAALINVNNVSARYRVGQKIDGTDYSVQSTAWNVVTLLRSDGSVQQLKFGDQNGVGNAPVPNSQAGFSGQLGIIPQNVARPVTTPTAPAANNAQQAQAALGDAIRQMKENPTGYIGQMGLTATNGKGYEVTNSVPANIRAQMGLRPGDRIVSVNGQPVGNPTTDAALLQQVQQSHSASVQIQRGEQTLTVQQSF
jgi:general secretion pathway protein C